MKSILDQIKAVKEDAKQAVDEMLQLRQELDEFEEYNPYPADKPFEERCAYCEKRLAMSDKADAALARANSKVIHFWELLGVNPVKFRRYDGETHVKETFYGLVRYSEEMEYQLKRVVETYNEYHHKN